MTNRLAINNNVHPLFGMLTILLISLAFGPNFSQQVVWSQTRNGSSFDDLMKPSTSRASAQEIIRKIPWQAIQQADQQRIRGIIGNHTIYRRLPMAGGYCNPELFDFLLCHPEMVVGFWETLGFTQLSLRPVRPGEYLLREKAGTVGKIKVVFHCDEMIILWCDGSYRGPMMASDIQGEMAIIIQIRYTEDKKGMPIVISRLDSFASIKNVGVDFVSKVFSPMIGKVADTNFSQTFDFMASISKAATNSPEELQETVLRTKSVDPETKKQFVALIDRIYNQTGHLARGTTIDYQLLPKMNQPEGNIARILARDDSRHVSHQQGQHTTQIVPANQSVPGQNVPIQTGRVPVQSPPAVSVSPEDTTPSAATARSSNFIPYSNASGNSSNEEAWQTETAARPVDNDPDRTAPSATVFSRQQNESDVELFDLPDPAQTSSKVILPPMPSKQITPSTMQRQSGNPPYADRYPQTGSNPKLQNILQQSSANVPEKSEQVPEKVEMAETDAPVPTLQNILNQISSSSSPSVDSNVVTPSGRAGEILDVPHPTLLQLPPPRQEVSPPRQADSPQEVSPRTPLQQSVPPAAIKSEVFKKSDDLKTDKDKPKQDKVEVIPESTWRTIGLDPFFENRVF